MRTTMKKLFVAVLFLGMSAMAHATSYITFRSTAVQVSVGVDMELVSIDASSGSASSGDSYLTVYDSVTLFVPNGTSSTNTPVNMVGAWLPDSTTLWPITQMITPPIVLYTTFTVNGMTQYNNYYDFTDKNGAGRPIANGLVIMKKGTDYGTIVTVGIRKRTDFWRR